MAGRRGLWAAYAAGFTIIVLVIVAAYVLSEEVLNRSPASTLQRFSGKCPVAGGNGTGLNESCAFNLTLSSGTVGFNWTVTAGNATLVLLTVNVTANGNTTTVDTTPATHSNSLQLTICNATLPHQGSCQAPPGNFSFELRTGVGVNGWANYRFSGYFLAKSQT